MSITVLPLLLTTATYDGVHSKFVVCWDSTPGVTYSVLTNNRLSDPATWAAAGTTSAADTNTCFTVPTRAGVSNLFTAIKAQ